MLLRQGGIQENLKTIKPITPRSNKEERIELDEIFSKVLFDYLFKDIDTILKDNLFYNAVDEILTQAFKSGKIHYQNGVIYGNFNSKISKIIQEQGGRWSPTSKGYQLNYLRLPLATQTFLNREMINQNKVKNEILEVLNKKTQPDLSLLNNKELIEQYAKIYKKVDNHFKVNINNINELDNIGLKERLTKNYINNLEMSIKSFADEEMQKIRTEVTKNVLQGYRADSFESIFKKHKGITDRKAKFLAENETRAVLSEYSKDLALTNNIFHYEWGHPTPNSPTARKGHVFLHNQSKNGVIYDFRNDPVNPDTNKPTRPGLEYNCGCYAILKVSS